MTMIKVIVMMLTIFMCQDLIACGFFLSFVMLNGQFSQISRNLIFFWYHMETVFIPFTYMLTLDTCNIKINKFLSWHIMH